MPVRRHPPNAYYYFFPIESPYGIFVGVSRTGAFVRFVLPPTPPPPGGGWTFKNLKSLLVCRPGNFNAFTGLRTFIYIRVYEKNTKITINRSLGTKRPIYLCLYINENVCLARVPYVITPQQHGAVKWQPTRLTLKIPNGRDYWTIR